MYTKTILRIWEKVRHKINPKRLYKYGTMGLSVFDDRSKIEKILDTIEIYVRRINTFFEEKKYLSRQVWHSYFDPSTGQMIESYSQIRDIEKKKGYSYTTYGEMEREAKKTKKRLRRERDVKMRDNIKKKLHDVKQGRSFVKEIVEKVRNEDINHKANRIKAEKYMNP